MSRDLRIDVASPEEAAAIAAMRTAAADHLTAVHGTGHWSSPTAERSVLRGIEVSRVIVAHRGTRVVGTLRLATKKPWAIDASCFQRVRKALYLTDMAVDPAEQRHGVGRRLLAEAATIARAWPSDAIRLDAYDAAAGAGGFYARCGYREVGRAIYRKTPLVYYELIL